MFWTPDIVRSFHFWLVITKSVFMNNIYITEIILLSQENIQEIGSVNVKVNVVLKLEIDKDYDRVSWPYMWILMCSMGCCELWIDLIFRRISGNMYSLLVNGSWYDFC